MENDEFRMQNGERKVAMSGARIDAQGCGLSPAESGFEHEIVSRGGHTAGNHLLTSSCIGGERPGASLRLGLRSLLFQPILQILFRPARRVNVAS